MIDTARRLLTGVRTKRLRHYNYSIVIQYTDEWIAAKVTKLPGCLWAAFTNMTQEHVFDRYRTLKGYPSEEELAEYIEDVKEEIAQYERWYE